jgi:hypothetical protein
MKIPINPRLPKNFDDTANELRPKSHNRWWFRPFIRTYDGGYKPGDDYYEKWLEAWPTGIRYDVRCLDGGAWDRTTGHGQFATLEEALKVASDLAKSYETEREDARLLFKNNPDAEPPEYPPMKKVNVFTLTDLAFLAEKGVKTLTPASSQLLDKEVPKNKNKG